MSEHPTSSELVLLKALWSAERMSAREVHDAAGRDLGWSYSTTRTVLIRMVDKGLLRRGAVHGLTVFEPAERKVTTLSRLIRNFAARVLEADPGALPASTFAGSRLLDEDEREELEALLRAAPADGVDDDDENSPQPGSKS